MDEPAFACPLIDAIVERLESLSNECTDLILEVEAVRKRIEAVRAWGTEKQNLLEEAQTGLARAKEDLEELEIERDDARDRISELEAQLDQALSALPGE